MEDFNPDLNGYSKVLVLNADLQPINICPWHRAITMVYKGKAIQLIPSGRLINQRYSLPYIIKLSGYIPLPFQRAVYNRKNLYLRDNHQCQYCGKTAELTVDHVIPKSRGGRDDWENVVVCCIKCNNKKGDLTLQEAGLTLKRQPYRPPSTLYLHMTRLPKAPECWYDFFFDRKKAVLLGA